MEKQKMVALSRHYKEAKMTTSGDIVRLAPLAMASGSTHAELGCQGTTGNLLSLTAIHDRRTSSSALPAQAASGWDGDALAPVVGRDYTESAVSSDEFIPPKAPLAPFTRRVRELRGFIERTHLPIEEWGDSEREAFRRLSGGDSLAVALALAGPYELDVSSVDPHPSAGTP